MRLQDQQEEENIRQAFWKAIKLYGKNQELAETYLDMDRQEEPELLKELKPVDFTASVGYDIPGSARYPQWLQKKNRKGVDLDGKRGGESLGGAENGVGGLWDMGGVGKGSSSLF